jgi:hypothetical protein
MNYSKTITLTLFLMIYTFASYAQEEDSTKMAIRKKSRRAQNFYFLQQTLNYSALSYASPVWFDHGSPKEWYVLSADIIPQFVIGGDWMPFPIHVTPRYKVRIFRNNETFGDSSLAVRTPSYMPGISVHFRIQDMDDDHLKIQYASLSFFHHSNGQDGTEFTNGEINTYNGNFSTNYIEPAYHFRVRNRLLDVFKEGGLYQPKDYFDFYGRMGYEFHFSTSDEIKSSYGTQRLNITLGLIEVIKRTDKYETIPFYRERNRIVLNSTIITGHRDNGMDEFHRRINFDLNYYWRIPSSPNTALFLCTGYYGSDPYNIYYMQSYWFVRAGLAFGFFVVPIDRGDKKLNMTPIK